MAAPLGRGQKRSNNNNHYPLVGGKKRLVNEHDYRLLIPAVLAPQVIGKQGCNIKGVIEKVKEVDEKARIMVYNEQLTGEPLMDGAADRVLGIKASPEAVEIAISLLIPLLQFPNNAERRVKAELRIMVPDHCCANIIGSHGANVKRIRSETKSFIQTYTVPLPYSEERLVRIQNFEEHDLCRTAMMIWESFNPFKNEHPVVLYEPIYFEQCAFDNTGSYIDTQYYQDAIASGALGHTEYSGKKSQGGARGGSRGGPRGMPRGGPRGMPRGGPRGGFRGGSTSAPVAYPPSAVGYGQDPYADPYAAQGTYAEAGGYGGYGEEAYSAELDATIQQEADALAQGIAIGMKQGMAAGMAKGAAMARGGSRGAPRGMPGAASRGMRGGRGRGVGLARGRGGMTQPQGGYGWENY